MRKVLIITCFSFLFSFWNKGYGCNCIPSFAYRTTTQIDTTKIVNDIETWYLQLKNNQNAYEKKVTPLMGESSEGGELSGYYEKDSLRIIVAIRAGEMGKSITEFYFKNNEMIFAISVDSLYDKPFYMKDYKIKTVEKTTYFFYKNELVRCLNYFNENSQYVTFKRSEDFNDEVSRFRKLLENE